LKQVVFKKKKFQVSLCYLSTRVLLKQHTVRKTLQE
jgi:hypothetical protein